MKFSLSIQLSKKTGLLTCWMKYISCNLTGKYISSYESTYILSFLNGHGKIADKIQTRLHTQYSDKNILISALSF